MYLYHNLCVYLLNSYKYKTIDNLCHWHSPIVSLPVSVPHADHLTTKHLLSTTVEMISAGTDTSSTALTWLFAFMAKYPGHQRRLFEALRRDGPTTPLLEATVLEVTRLATIVPFALPHRCRSTRCHLFGYPIDHGCLVYANLWSVGRDRVFWGPDVDDFKPSRFLDTSVTQHPKVGGTSLQL